MIRLVRNLWFLLLVFTEATAQCQVKLPSLISDGMVLQREVPVRIWGWDNGGKSVTVEFAGKTLSGSVNTKGLWEVIFPAMPAGGPYTISISGTSSVIVNDVLIGDVWVCSGQSNMELNMRRASPIYGPEIAASENNSIRYFAAPQSYNFNERVVDYKGGKWQKTNPETVLNFGALAYFFAREINAKYKIPVGIINTAIGGTPTEAWLSEDAIKNFPDYYNELQRFKDQSLIDKIEKDNREKPTAWYRELGLKDAGYLDPQNKWTSPDLNTSGWDIMKVPGYWASTSLGPVNGVVWFRKKFEVPSGMAEKAAKLNLGRIVDADSVFINGTFVGTTSYQYPPRRYEVPAGILHAGTNTIVVRVINNGGQGGFVPDKPYELVSGDIKINLAGDWQFRLGASMKPTPGGITVKYKPAGLFNAMISPLLAFHIKGVLWYQGESNTDRAAEQKKIFPALISDWRKNWNQGDFPFLYVQLPNFMASRPEPSESNWALFREAQASALSVPNTAMAVAIDLGEWNDIHPLNKLDVAKRLALAAGKVAYGDKVVFSGPVYKSMKIKGNRFILDFASKGSGLMARGDSTLNQFAIAGSDRKFTWARAIIKNNKVVVWSDAVTNPVAVRYAWADNPAGANLYNKEGLPASPFRTDNW
jgi:sialate O-acetylesterase